MSNVLKMLSRGGAAAAETDPNFNQTVLLLHGDGTNGAQNNTFLDSSTNNFTITRNGNTTQGTFSPFSVGAGEWSNYFDGSGDYLSLANNSAFHITTGNFCVEMWIYRTVGSVVEQMLLSQRTTTGWEWRINSTNLMQFFFVAGSSITSTSTIPVNSWTHLAVTRDSNTVRMFINGSLDATTTFADGTSATQSLFLGYGTTGGAYFSGYISNARLVKGSAVYTSAFTPSTTPLTAITNTSLLTCQSNRFVDNSTNAFAITRNGDVRVTPFSPFAPTAAYSAGTNGGSGYFDGSGDMLETPSISVGTSIFCFECWLYPTVTQGANTGIFVADTNNGLQLSYYDGASPGGLGIAQKGVAWQVFNNTGVKPIVGQWNHVAFVRSGTGTNETSIFLNGSRIANGTVSYNYASSLYELSTTNAAGTVFQGYIAGARLTLGSTPYDATQTTLTIPTAPLTAITNTSLLLNFTNAGILDQTGKNVLETVGNAQIDTTTKKYGTGSMKFDGTGDYLIMKDTPEMAFGSGDFTIEFWLNTSDLGAATDKALIDFRPSGTNGAYPYLYIYQSKIRYWFQSADRIIQASTLSTGTWYHVALTRSGSGTKLFVNGTQEDSTYTNSDTLLVGTNRPVVGANSALGANFNGYIDDLRITKGVARYTANFTPPTKEFPDL